MAKAFVNQVVSHLNQVAPVTARAMFGGYGLYAEGVMFGLIADETLYFKVDDQNRPSYLAAGSEPFTYDRNGKPIQMSYYRLPDAVFENIEQLAAWVEAAQAAARRGKLRKH
jgi:DNA transformation protein